MKIPMTGLELRLFRGGTRQVEVLTEPTSSNVTKAYVFQEDGWLSRIIWPKLETDDPWVKLAYSKAIEEFMSFHKRNSFDMCATREIKAAAYGKDCGLHEPADVSKKLHMVHCVNFDTLPREIVDSIPDLLNEYFGTTRLEREVDEDKFVNALPKP